MPMRICTRACFVLTFAPRGAVNRTNFTLCNSSVPSPSHASVGGGGIPVIVAPGRVCPTVFVVVSLVFWVSSVCTGPSLGAADGIAMPEVFFKPIITTGLAANGLATPSPPAGLRRFAFGPRFSSSASVEKYASRLRRAAAAFSSSEEGTIGDADASGEVRKRGSFFSRCRQATTSSKLTRQLFFFERFPAASTGTSRRAPSDRARREWRVTRNSARC